jgi:succinate-semialdehyde dehydrogenase/glutarate-semialdehyde dehydrogenase
LAWRRLIVRDRDFLAESLSRENGKPLSDSLTELLGACEFLAHAARTAPVFLRERPLVASNPLLRHVRTMKVHRARGVVGIISPWNYPCLLPMASMVPALITGNPVLLKPSEWTPRIAILLVERAHEAGIPREVLQVLPGDREVGKALVAAGLDHVCFTGSVASGKRVAAACAEHLTTVTLELGGKDAALVLPDADLDFAAQGIVWAAMVNAGQVCASAERVLVLPDQAGPLLERLEARVRALKVGAWDEPGVEVGPMIGPWQRETVVRHLAEAIASGARPRVGGGILERPGCFHAPTLIEGVTADMALWHEETFGPVLPVMVVPDLETMVRVANDTEFGLSATVWGRDLGRAEAIARRLDVGTAWVNTALDTYGNPVTPRGGIKASGIGRVGGDDGFAPFVQARVIDVQAEGRRSPVWFPAAAGLDRFLSAGIDLFHGDSWTSRARSAFTALRHWPRS